MHCNGHLRGVIYSHGTTDLSRLMRARQAKAQEGRGGDGGCKLQWIQGSPGGRASRLICKEHSDLHIMLGVKGEPKWSLCNGTITKHKVIVYYISAMEVCIQGCDVKRSKAECIMTSHKVIERIKLYKTYI